MKRILVLLLLTSAFYVQAQKITLSGRVIDIETREPLPYASISIKGKSIGTIANLQGEFDFHISAESKNDILVVSMLGYANFESPIWSLTDNAKPLLIELNKGSILLQEVIIKDTLRAGEVLQIALSRIEQNYAMQPFMMDGFYRDLKKLGGTYISLLEAAVKIYDEDYKKPRNQFKLRERVSLQEIRRSYGYENKFTSFFDQDNLLEDLLLNNNVRYRQFPSEQFFFDSLRRNRDSQYYGHNIYVLQYAHEYLLRVYVDKETFGIIHLEYENDEEQKIEKKRDLVSKFVKIRRIIDFKSFNSKLYLNYLEVDSHINWYDKETMALKFETELQRQLLINNVYPNTDERISAFEKMRSFGLQHQSSSYNKDFWDNYNVIKESPLDKKIIEDLEKAEGPLEKQFKKDN